MSYCIGTNTSTIKTCLSKNQIIPALKGLWCDEVLHNICLIAADEEDATSYADVFRDEVTKFVEIDDMLDEVFGGYALEGDDFPAFVEEGVVINEDGSVDIKFCTEGGAFRHSELTDYFCFVVQSAYGAGDYYERSSVGEHSNGCSLVVSHVHNNGDCEVVYRNN